jgi:L-cysteine desulfidase
MLSLQYTILYERFSSLSSMRSSGCPMPSSTTPHRGNVGTAKGLPINQHRRGIKDSRIIRKRVFAAYSRSD